MQKQKENIRQRLLDVAKKEFTKNGYKETSMRAIASKSDICLSNIYNYFRNKDELFKTVLDPLLLAFEDVLIEHNDDIHISMEAFINLEYQEKQALSIIKLVKKYNKELKLLFLKSTGSSLENFREDFIKQQTITGKEYIKRFKEKYPYCNDNISETFIRTTCALWLTIISEIISNDKLNNKEMMTFLNEYVQFCTAGWKSLMGV
ncbi:MAG: TetR/AcrR family transcriptional regulator [Marinifilaceae bacterium]|jgi:AcrR family transcriptional regulator|nr:TetR/AcrR family transcriptional regulator [Marinifilaceae bacterium]